MSLDKKVSDLLPAQIPDYVQEFYPLFVVFVTKYFEWLEQEGNPQSIIQNVQLNVDIDTTASSLATKFMSIYAPNLPQTSALDRTILVKHFRDFYRSRGSEESFKFFFRAFFDDEITIKLPGEQLFRPSDADWYVEKKLRVNAVTGNPRQLTAVEITGNSSNATAIVEEVVNTYGAWDLRLQNRSLIGTFNSSETITGVYYDHANNVSSTITVLNTNELETLPGRQRGSASLLSSDQVIQDSIYWQKFSYVIRTRTDLSRWQDAVLEQLHPTGRNLFGEILLDNSTSMAVSSTTQFSQSNQIVSEVRLFTSSNSFYLVPGVTWDRLANFRTGTSATTSAGAVVFDPAFSYGGENVTFALQGAIDGATVFQESFAFTSITGTVDVPVTTGQTLRYSIPGVGLFYRDFVRYSAPVTSITGTINAVQQAGGDEITFTGTGTQFSSELIPSSLQTWWRFSGRNIAQTAEYNFYPAVLTIQELPVTGTVTIAAQTPVAPDYFIYVSGVNTRFRRDLLITNVNTSAGITAETTIPAIEDGQPEPRIYLDNLALAGDLTFTSGSTSVVGINSFLLSEIYPVSASLTVTKPLFGRWSQVTSIPAVLESWEFQTSLSLGTTISGTTLSFTLTTSNYSAISTTAFGTDRSTRYDIPLPFPVQILNTSTTKLYVHASGFVASDTSVPSSFLGVFRPFHTGPFIGVFPSVENRLDSVHHGVSGTAPNRYYTIHYNGRKGRAGTGATIAFGFVAQTTQTIRGAAALGTALTTPTSGTLINGYFSVTLPWTIWVGRTVVTSIHVSNRAYIVFNTPRDTDGLTSFAGQEGLGLYDPGYLYPGFFDYNYSTQEYNDVTSVQRIYSATVGTAPNRSHIVRFEGDWQTSTVTAGNSKYIFELEFKESDLSSITVHFGHPAQNPATFYNVYGFSYERLTYGNYFGLLVSSENQDGVSYTRSYNTTYNIPPNVYDQNSGYYVPVTAGLVTANFSNPELRVYPFFTQAYITQPSNQKWEVSFPENSASPVIFRGGDVSTDNGNPGAAYARYNYATGTYNTSNPVWATSLEWSEFYPPDVSGISTRTGLATLIFSDGRIAFNDSSTLRVNFSRIPSSVAITTSIPGTSNSRLLLRSWNAIQGDIFNPTTSYTARAFYYNIGNNARLVIDNTFFLSYVVFDTNLIGTSTGVIARYPQDGYNATSLNRNPNPTLDIRKTSTRYGTISSGWFGNYDNRTTAFGILFSYGSSATVHSRFLQTVPVYGRTHRLNVSGFAGSSGVGTSSYYNNELAPVFTGQDLEAWYSTNPNPQPPTAGQTPSALGWTRWGALVTPTNATFPHGMTSNYGNAFEITANITTTENTSVTWLIWQKSFTTQTSNAAQRLSEYLINFINVVAIPTETRSNNRNVLSSGSVVRVPVRSTQAGATVLEDYYVDEDPRRRTIFGDQYLVLRPVGTVTSVPYQASINSYSTGGTTSYGLYDVSLSNVQLNFVETRTVNSVINQTTLTVTAAWSSTSNRVWGGGAGSGVSRRALAIESVPSDTSLVLRNVVGASRFNAPITISTTVAGLQADRRFTIVSVNNDNDVQVSGGGIYANITGKTATFATPRTTTIDGQTGYLIYGADDNIVNTSLNTRWATDGLPGTDDQGNGYGTRLDDLTVVLDTLDENNEIVETSSFTVLRIFSDSSILVTGSAITGNFFNVPMACIFPANCSQLTIVGTGTQFIATSVTVSEATKVFEEVTEFDFSDRRTGYLDVSGQLLRVISIVDNNTLIVSSLAIRAALLSSTATSFRRIRGFEPPRALGRPGGASFDKAGATISNDESLIVQDANVDYTQIRELYHTTSNLTLGTSTTLLSTSISVAAGSSVLLLVTWTKDLADSADEVLNQLTIAVSSTGTFVVGFDDEVQRNHKDIAQGRTQLYRGSVYLNSSNSISSNTVSHGDVTSTASWIWVPYNVKRSGTFSRFTLLISSSQSTSISIDIGTGLTGSWQSLASDFLNISVIGTS